MPLINCFSTWLTDFYLLENNFDLYPIHLVGCSIKNNLNRNYSFYDMDNGLPCSIVENFKLGWWFFDSIIRVETIDNK